MSLDEVLYAVYDIVKDEYNNPFDVLKNMILEANGIDESEKYTKKLCKIKRIYFEVNQKIKILGIEKSVPLNCLYTCAR